MKSQLTTEQEFEIQKFRVTVEHISLAQAKELLLNMHVHIVVMKSTYNELLKDAWGLEHGINHRPTT